MCSLVKGLPSMHKVLHSITRPTKKDNGELARQKRHCLNHWTFDTACFKTDFLILACVQLAPCLRLKSQNSPPRLEWVLQEAMELQDLKGGASTISHPGPWVVKTKNKTHRTECWSLISASKWPFHTRISSSTWSPCSQSPGPRSSTGRARRNIPGSNGGQRSSLRSVRKN